MIEEEVLHKSKITRTPEQVQEKQEEESRDGAAAFEEGKALCELINDNVEKMNTIVRKADTLREELRFM